eukprot:CAMPEP_0179133362 /NCGR_PEP_ID=MMETSP0796-20121207/63416_1 /TAXON_ID=73915 /ORGANISM="Pyrodinium bahamense, Strain pbaha01" /LENGTH=620 /DNA_ID=CAMNT_0020832321 /DNA_START=19 /DNA_END=1881 /DNA_ORIENTATION=+
MLSQAHAFASLLLVVSPAIAVAARTGRAGAAALQNVGSKPVAEASRTGAADAWGGDALSTGPVVATSSVAEAQSHPMPSGTAGEAGATNDVQQSSDAALVYIHNRLAQANREKAHLRDQLSQALRREQDLSQKLADNRRGAKVMAKRVRKLLLRKARKDAAVLAVERRREQTLGQHLRNISRAFAMRGKALESASKSLAAAQRERDRLHSALSAAEKKSATLSGRLDVASGNLADLRQELAWSRQGFENAKSSWHEEETELQQAEAAKQAELKEREKALLEEHKKLRVLKAAKKVKVAELSDLEREGAKVAAVAQAQLSKERAREDHLQGILVTERKASDRRINLLAEALKLRDERLEEERTREGKLQQQLASFKDSEREEAAAIVRRVKAEDAQVQDLVRENSALHEELNATATTVAHLGAEATLLRHRMEDINRARLQAESTARKAKKSMEDSQAIAKQLAGTVPRLLEQARRAQEALAAEEALRKQMQATAQRQVQKLQRQYATVIHSRLEQMIFARPSLGGNASDASKSKASQMDDLTAILEQPTAAQPLPLSDDQEVIGEVADRPGNSATPPAASPEIEDAPIRPPHPDLSPDGLSSLPAEDDSSSTEAQAVPSS